MNYNKFRSSLEQSSSTWFKNSGFNTNPKHPYILLHEKDWGKNILLPEVYEYILEAKRLRNYPFPLHNWLHNGLSSQAMLFNLFGPLVVKKSLSVLEEPLKEIGIELPKVVSGVFEYQDKLVFNELQPQPTSLDFAILDKSDAPKILFEAKLVEKGFGLCSRLRSSICSGLNPLNKDVHDPIKECELVKMGREYWKVLNESNALTEVTKNGPTCPMAIFYQFYREIGFAIKTNSQLVFLVDERNPFFSPNYYSSLTNKLIKTLNSSAQSRIKIVTIQRIFKEIEKIFSNQSWVKSFSEKYNLDNQG